LSFSNDDRFLNDPVKSSKSKVLGTYYIPLNYLVTNIVA
jgi:hypothetical protein